MDSTAAGDRGDRHDVRQLPAFPPPQIAEGAEGDARGEPLPTVRP